MNPAAVVYAQRTRTQVPPDTVVKSVRPRLVLHQTPFVRRTSRTIPLLTVAAPPKPGHTISAPKAEANPVAETR